MLLLALVTILATTWLAAFALLYAFQPSFIYFPARTLAATPADAGLAWEDVRLRTADGVALHGWYVPAEPVRGTLLFLHGNAGNISHRLSSLAQFHRLGLATLIVDYRGYGRSEGSPDEAGTYADAHAAWRYLTAERGIDPGRIVVFGRSLGGAVAAELAARTTPAGLIVESAFTSVRAMSRHYYPWLPTALLVRIRYPTLAYLRAIRCPVLVAHSRADEIVPPAFGRELYAAAPGPKWFLELDGGHNDGHLVTGSRYLEALDRFLAQVLPPSP